MGRNSPALRLVRRFAIALAVAAVVHNAPAVAGDDHLQLTAPKAPAEAASNLVLRRTAIVIAAGHNGSGT
jgi:hypothetical protein